MMVSRSILSDIAKWCEIDVRHHARLLSDMLSVHNPSPPPALQCHFMSMLWFRALRDYMYAMRVDEDVCITRLPIHKVIAAPQVDCAPLLTIVHSVVRFEAFFV